MEGLEGNGPAWALIGAVVTALLALAKDNVPLFAKAKITREERLVTAMEQHNTLLAKLDLTMSTIGEGQRVTLSVMAADISETLQCQRQIAEDISGLYSILRQTQPSRARREKTAQEGS